MGNLFSTASSSTTTTPTKMLLSTASSSTTTTLTKKYDVFISFRGEDTRKGITSHLYKALCQKQIKAFIDNPELEGGDKISPALLRAIEGSKIAVVIFSKDYASSKWCLRELVEIIMCKKIVMPVFYEVNASDVRKQKGSFEDSFAKHKNESQEEVQKWREALTKASNSSGWDSSVTRSDAELVDEIVEGISKKLLSECRLSSSDFEGLVGICKRIERVISLLCLDDKTDVRIIGIWGMGGIGKTTLANAIFKQILSQFEGACFKNVRETVKKYDGVDCLECEVLSNVLDERNLKLNIPIISPFIKERLSRQRVFIVLDDVDDFKKLITFARGFNQFGLGSRIIITSRDRQVLRNCGVNDHNIYEVDGFNHDEALTLFCNYAFRQNHPTKDFMVLAERIVDYAKGNPLALEVLGSSLNGMSKQQWESALDNLKGIVNSGIFEVLKMSYDTLSREEKALFLDIACFFKGCREDNIAKLVDCELHLGFLIAKSLITIKEGIITMHDLLQEMGREIVYRESESNPGKRSRLWEQDDVISMLRNDMGTEEVEGISLDMDIPEDVYLSHQDVYLSRHVLDKMQNLKFLLFKKNNNYNYVCTSIKLHLLDGLNYLPNSLRILQWPEYPLRELPSKFDPEKLVELDLSGSNIEQLWEGTTRAPNLKLLFLNDCGRLIRIPNLSHFHSLEEVHLSCCKSLVDFPSSIQQLNNLRYLCLWMCSNVTKIPLISGSIERLQLGRTAIEEVPSSIQSLTNLTYLGLSGCRRLKNISTNICKLKALCCLYLGGCSELETFPDILETMGLLKTLGLSGTAIKELPPSIKHLKWLQDLGLSNCKNLEILPSKICDLKSLKNLNLSNCSKLNKLPDNLGNLKSLKELRVEGSAIGQLPSSNTSLDNLKGLYSSECRGLTILLGLCSLTKLYLNNCNIMKIPEDIGCLSSLVVLEMCGNMFESLPKSIKRLSKLEILSVRDCNMLRSLTELPVALSKLDAKNCKQLCQALSDASEFKLCIHSKPPHIFNAHFFFLNCFNLDQKTVSNVLVESLKGSEESPTQFSIFLPGSEIPNCFSYRSSGSSVNIPVLWQASVNRKFMGFAICSVLGFQEQEFQDYNNSFWVDVSCRFETCDVSCRFETCDLLISGPYTEHPLFMNSDHILLGYIPCPYYVATAKVSDISLEFKAKSPYSVVKCCAETPHIKVKCCAAYPIYAEPIEIIGATIEDIGETSGRKRDRSDDNEDQVEPHPKRICTQVPNQIDAPKQQSRPFIFFSLRTFGTLSTVGLLFYLRLHHPKEFKRFSPLVLTTVLQMVLNLMWKHKSIFIQSNPWSGRLQILFKKAEAKARAQQTNTKQPRKTGEAARKQKLQPKETPTNTKKQPPKTTRKQRNRQQKEA